MLNALFDQQRQLELELGYNSEPYIPQRKLRKRANGAVKKLNGPGPSGKRKQSAIQMSLKPEEVNEDLEFIHSRPSMRSIISRE